MPISKTCQLLQERPYLADYAIRLANQEQDVSHARIAFTHWNHDRSWEAFRETSKRERSVAPWGKDGRLLTWVLVRDDDPEGEIYAGCETYRRTGRVKRRGSDELEPKFIYGIASVVTPIHHLRKGLATRFPSLLHQQLGESTSLLAQSSELVPRGIASILWLDIGSEFYSRCTITNHQSGAVRPGWQVDDKQSSQLVWRILPTSHSYHCNGEHAWECIYKSDMSVITSRPSQEAKKRLLSTDTTEKAAYIQDPASDGTLTFTTELPSWYWAPKTDPAPYGNRIKSRSKNNGDDAGEGIDAIVLFVLSNPSISPRLHISYIAHLTPEQLPTLLEALDTVAKEEGITEAWTWDIDATSELAKAWKQVGRERDVTIGKRAEVDGHLLAVAWYGEEEARLLDGQLWSWC